MNEHEMDQRNGGEEREQTVSSRRRFLLGLVAAGLAYAGPLLLGLDEAEAAPRSKRTRPSRRGRGPSRRGRGRGPSRRGPSRRNKGRGPSRRNNGRGPSRRGPSRRNDGRGPSRRNNGRGPSRRNNGRGPSRRMLRPASGRPENHPVQDPRHI